MMVLKFGQISSLPADASCWCCWAPLPLPLTERGSDQSHRVGIPRFNQWVWTSASLRKLREPDGECHRSLGEVMSCFRRATSRPGHSEKRWATDFKGPFTAWKNCCHYVLVYSFRGSCVLGSLKVTHVGGGKVGAPGRTGVLQYRPKKLLT